MKTSRRARRRMTFAALAAGTALLAAGCATAEAGSAAVVGDTTIRESSIAAQVRELNEATGKPVTAPNAPVTLSLVNYNVLYELVNQAAAEAGVSVPPGAVDKAYGEIEEQAGGEEQLLQLATQQGIPPGNIRRDIEVQLTAGALANKIAPGLGQQEQQQALLESLGSFSEDVGVDVAPKYGSWNAAALQIGPPEDPVSKRVEPVMPNGITELPGQ